MNKILCSLLLIAVLGTVQCESFKRIHLDQGRVHVERNLEVTTPAGRLNLEGSSPDQTVAAATILPDFLKANKIETTNTPMMVYLTSSDSGFCYDCTSFVNLQCNKDTGCEQAGSYIYPASIKIIGGGRRVTNEGTFVNLPNNSWVLANKPLVMNTFSQRGGALPEKAAYGFIGLGTEGEARKNFAGEFPQFSVSLNKTGKGSLIFGNDTALIQTNRKEKALRWNTDANWIADLTGVNHRYFNKTNAENDKYKVHFDLNQNKTTMTSEWYSDIVKALNLTANMSNTASGELIFNATIMGPITKIQPLNFTIDGQSMTFPLEAFFQKVDDPKHHVYKFMVEAMGEISNQHTGKWEKIVIFGTHFLSNFYAVFTAPKDKSNYVELHPVYTAFTAGSTPSTSSGGSGGKFLIGLIAVIGLGAVGFIVFRNKAASKLQEHLNEK